MSKSKYLNLTDLGKLFGETSHTVGAWLLETDLRTRSVDGKRVPTSKAFEEGFITKVYGETGHYNYLWDAEKTIAVLEAAGRERIDTPAVVHPLAGPFSLKQTSSNAYQIVNKDGTCSLRGVGKQNMDELLKLMNLAHKHGKLDCTKK
ncbi:MAG: hypothetical protein HQ567_33990 [Candidatus Nealsonbacteria bacterium]|nr:hypothetical protein [Candidatus Nealsonbacteria bacterium]